MYNKFLFGFFLLALSLAATLSSTSHSMARTYIVNGLASAVPFIGYGMNNLGKRLPDAKVFSYITSIEGNTVIRPAIVKDIINRYNRNPNEKINLIGISYGAKMVSEISVLLSKTNIPVNYLAIIEGGRIKAIPQNVKKADNFMCTDAECSKKRIRLAAGNKNTALSQFTYKDGHINLGNNTNVHQRIVAGVR